MNKSFEVGSVVILKSGGPIMVVEYSDATTANCIFWHPSHHVFTKETFDAKVLKIYDAKRIPIYNIPMDSQNISDVKPMSN